MIQSLQQQQHVDSLVDTAPFILFYLRKTAGLLDVFVVAGVAWPYIPQAKSIWKDKNPDSFSLMTSLVVIVSATLRCFYFIGNPFGIALLVQAMVSIVAQMAMIWVVLKTRNHNRNADLSAGRPVKPKRTLADFEVNDFWKWDDFASFLQFEAALVMLLAGLQLALGNFSWFIQLQGALALGIEALLPVPQAMRNHAAKSTAGVSGVMVVSWLAGDFFKTIYALGKGEPAPFVLCGAFQFSVDCVVAAQMFVLYPSGGSASSSSASAGSAAGATELSAMGASAAALTSGAAATAGDGAILTSSAGGVGAGGLVARASPSSGRSSGSSTAINGYASAGSDSRLIDRSGRGGRSGGGSAVGEDDEEEARPAPVPSPLAAAASAVVPSSANLPRPI